MATVLCRVKFISRNFSAVNENNHVSSGKDSRSKGDIQTQKSTLIQEAGKTPA